MSARALAATAALSIALVLSTAVGAHAAERPDPTPSPNPSFSTGDLTHVTRISHLRLPTNCDGVENASGHTFLASNGMDEVTNTTSAGIVGTILPRLRAYIAARPSISCTWTSSSSHRVIVTTITVVSRADRDDIASILHGARFAHMPVAEAWTMNFPSGRGEWDILREADHSAPFDFWVTTSDTNHYWDNVWALDADDAVYDLNHWPYSRPDHH